MKGSPDFEELDVAIINDSSKYLAAVNYSDVVREQESATKLKNRMNNYFIQKYNGTFISSRIDGKGDQKRLVVILNDENARLCVTDDIHTDLINKEGNDAPVFHPYDPKSIRAEELSRTIIVTDILMFITES